MWFSLCVVIEFLKYVFDLLGDENDAVAVLVSFPDPAFTKDKSLAHFARNHGLADSALPEIWRTNEIAYTC